MNLCGAVDLVLSAAPSEWPVNGRKACEGRRGKLCRPGRFWCALHLPCGVKLAAVCCSSVVLQGDLQTWGGAGGGGP